MRQHHLTSATDESYCLYKGLSNAPETIFPGHKALMSG
jgi:hypothetical protein